MASIGSKQEQLQRVFATVVVPFEIESADPLLKAKAVKIFQMIYSKEFFGSGIEACSLVIDRFVVISSPLQPYAVKVKVAALKISDKMGLFHPLKREIIIDSSLLAETDVEEMRGEPLEDVLGTVVHEMTHAVHYTSFNSAYEIDEVQKELGCTPELYRAALKEAAANLPRYAPWRSPFVPLPLDTVMKTFFIPPAEQVDLGIDVVAFNEFVARIPEMYYRFGESESKQAIDQSLEKIFPLAFKFFWGPFQAKCKEPAKLPQPKPKQELTLPNISHNGMLHAYERECAKELFRMIYEKKFFDPSQDKALNQIVNSFIRMNQRHDKYHIEVCVCRPDDLRFADRYEKPGMEHCLDSGCYYYTYLNIRGFVNEHKKQLALSTKFLNEFSTLSEKSKGQITPELKTLLMKIIDEMEKPLLEALRG